MISLIELLKSITLEGGNVFGTTSRIKKEYVQPTLKKFTAELSKIYPKVKFNFNTLGSAGKSEDSGDIDLGMSSDQFIDENGNPLLSNWGIDKVEFNRLYEKIRKNAKSAKEAQSKLRAMLELIAIDIEKKSDYIDTNLKSASNGSIFCNFPQYNEKGEILNDKAVQIDINVGDLDWLNFSYYSNTINDNVKGLHRTQLMVAMFKVLDKIFSHGVGVKDKTTKEIVATNPQEALAILNQGFGLNLSQDVLNDYFELMEVLRQSVENKKLSEKTFNQILDVYLKILDSTNRADIPLDLQEYWIANQKSLDLKGKLLPKDSNLNKYKVA